MHGKRLVTKPDRPIAEIIVRRGALRRYDALVRKSSELPVRLRWDRRVEKGQPPSGAPERRGPAPFTWKTADFVVIDLDSESS